MNGKITITSNTQLVVIILLIYHGGSNSDSLEGKKMSSRKVFQHWDLFNSETLVGQHHRLEGLAGILQVVSESFHEWRFIHEGNSVVASNDSHSLTWLWTREWIEGGMWVWSLERRHWRNFGFKVDGPLGSGKHKLFGIRRQLAWDGSS